MKQSQFYRAIFVLMTAIAVFLVAILICIITKDEWQFFETTQFIAFITLFVAFILYGGACYWKGKIDERHRQRARITSLMDTYQTEPHGIRFSQKAR